MARKNQLGLDDDDLENIKTVMNDLIDTVAAFQGAEDHTDSHYAALKSALDFSMFVVDGIIYKNGLYLGDPHDGDECNCDGDDDDE